MADIEREMTMDDEQIEMDRKMSRTLKCLLCPAAFNTIYIDT